MSFFQLVCPIPQALFSTLSRTDIAVVVPGAIMGKQGVSTLGLTGFRELGPHVRYSPYV
jgi:hypothetical protein